MPGDSIQIEAGNLLPAYVRLLEAVNLRIQEAALTSANPNPLKNRPRSYPVKICLLTTVASIVVLDVVDHALDLTEAMNKSGSFSATRSLGVPARSALSMTALGGALCNDARLIDEGDDRYHTLGDPTEGALHDMFNCQGLSCLDRQRKVMEMQIR